MKSLQFTTAFLLTLAPLVQAQNVVDAPAAAPSMVADLPVEEQHIRAGAVLLAVLYNTLAAVHDHESAQAAVPTIVRLTREFQAWGQGISALPPLSADAKERYEARYMPTIRRLNDHLRAQGERLAASDYFGTPDLSSALISLYCTTQQ